MHEGLEIKGVPVHFPEEIIEKFIKCSNILGILGNKVASGTEIIKEYGDLHVKTGKPIVYTSADSVFQIACHEAVFPPEKLYEICEIWSGSCIPILSKSNYKLQSEHKGYLKKISLYIPHE